MSCTLNTLNVWWPTLAGWPKTHCESYLTHACTTIVLRFFITHCKLHPHPSNPTCIPHPSNPICIHHPSNPTCISHPSNPTCIPHPSQSASVTPPIQPASLTPPIPSAARWPRALTCTSGAAPRPLSHQHRPAAHWRRGADPPATRRRPPETANQRPAPPAAALRPPISARPPARALEINISSAGDRRAEPLSAKTERPAANRTTV